MLARPLMKWKTDRRTFLKIASAGAGGAALFSGATSFGAQGGYPNLADLQLAHRKAEVISPGKTYRTMEWEFHMPPQERFNDINLEAAMRASRDAGAESLMLYTQGHWGYALYPSEVAVRQPHLNYDLFGTEVSLARKYDLSVTAYYSLQANEQCIISHPDWAWVNEKGKAMPPGGRWYAPCLDTPYRQLVLAMMGEIFSRYKCDALFLDLFGVQALLYHTGSFNPFCFCKYTEAKWNREHPGDPYREGFKSREGWERRYQWLVKDTMADMLDEIIAVARKHQPNVLVALNGGPEWFPSEIMRKVSYCYSEPLPCPTGISLGSILMRGWGRPDYQAGVPTLPGEYGYQDMYPVSIPRVQADALIVQNARTFIIGGSPIIDGLDGQGFSKRWFAEAKVTWGDVRNVDCLLGPELRPLLSTAMLFSESTREELDIERRPLAFRHSTLGALEVMSYAGRPVESLPEFRLSHETLESFEVLVLPEVEVLSDGQAEVIRRWVSEGGALIASYKSGLRDGGRRKRRNFALADVLGVDYIAEERKYAYNVEGKLRKGNFTSTYLESAGHRLAKMLSVSTVGVPGPFVRMKRTTAEEVMYYRLPFMVQDMARHQFFNWGPPPPGSEIGGTAVAYNKFGKGQSLYLGVPIFWAMQQWRAFWIQDWIPALIRELVPHPLVELRPRPFSEYVHGSFFYDEEKKLILMQVLNTIELATKGEMRAAPKVEVRVDASRLRVTGARVVWPEERDLTVTEGEGEVRFALESLARYSAVYLKLSTQLRERS